MKLSKEHDLLAQFKNHDLKKTLILSVTGSYIRGVYSMQNAIRRFCWIKMFMLCEIAQLLISQSVN